MESSGALTLIWPRPTTNLDDILIFTKTLDDHLVLLDKVLAKLAETGLKVRKDKCAFAVDSTEFLG